MDKQDKSGIMVAKKAKTRELTIKQQRYIDAFDGSVKEAAKEARISYQYARDLQTKSYIREAIRMREQTEKRPKNIATRQERQKFWTREMLNTKNSMKDRLKASELLGKSEADFTENIKVIDEKERFAHFVDWLRGRNGQSTN
jgi:hypothetical protein